MNARATLVADLGFGDAGKGSIVDFLARQSESSVVVRYNGGPQAAHNVITPDGKHHTFAQFGSGSFVPGVRTHLSRYMLINPLNAIHEADHLIDLGVRDIWLRTTFDQDAMVITPFHVAMNRLREIARGGDRHGSCGQGIGETRSLDIADPGLTVRVRDLADPVGLRIKLKRIQSRLRAQAMRLQREVPPSRTSLEARNTLSGVAVVDELITAYQHFLELARIEDSEHLAQLSTAHEHLIFEGAQGVLLDEKYGFHPYTTWSDITYHNAFQVLSDIGFSGDVTRLGLMRGYATRHGAGPFVTEDEDLTNLIPDMHNGMNRWQEGFRVGYADMVATRYAIRAVGGIDDLAITNLDRMQGIANWRITSSYDGIPLEHAAFIYNADDTVADIIFKDGEDLDRQSTITDALFTASPRYRDIQTPSGDGKLVTDEDFETYCELLRSHLGSPRNSIVSFGPSSSDKRSIDYR